VVWYYADRLDNDPIGFADHNRQLLGSRPQQYTESANLLTHGIRSGKAHRIMPHTNRIATLHIAGQGGIAGKHSWVYPLSKLKVT
jgi:hypothetical protein